MKRKAKYKQILDCVRRQKTLLNRRDKTERELRLLQIHLAELLEPTPRPKEGNR